MADAPRPLAGRILRGAAWSAAGLAGLCLALAAALLVGLHTSWGERRLARFAADQANGALAGHLALDRARVRGALELCLSGVDLRDPSGHPAFAAKEVCASLDLAALAGRRLRLRALRLVAPRVDLAELPPPAAGPEGRAPAATNTLLAALAPRTPAPTPPAASSGTSSLVVLLDRLDLEDGQLVVRPAPGAPPKLSLDGLRIDRATALYSSTGAAVKVALEGRMAVPGGLPLDLALDLSVDGAPDGLPAAGRVAITGARAWLGESGLSAEGRLDLGALQGELRVTRLQLTPRDLAALQGAGSTSTPLLAKVSGTARLLLDGLRAKASVQLQAAEGRLDVEASATLGGPLRWSASAKGERLDPSKLARGGPAGEVALTLDAHGVGVPALTARGLEGEAQGRLSIGPARLEGVGALRADLDLSLQAGEVAIHTLRAEALSLAIRGKGTAGPSRLALALDAEAPDLSRFARELAALDGTPRLPLSGSARLHARVTGSPGKPDADLELRAPSLVLGGLQIAGLAVDGRLRGPIQSATGALQIGARRFALGEMDLGQPRVRVDLAWPVARLAIDAAVRAEAGSEGDEDGDGSGQLTIRGDARLEPDGARLSGFTVAWPGGSFRLVRPSRLRLREAETTLEPIRLVGEHGEIGLTARLRTAPELGHQTSTPQSAGQPPPAATLLDVQASLLRVDLAHLPRFLLPAQLTLGGTIDAAVQVTGSSGAPEVEAELQLHGVRAQQIHGLEGRLQAHLHAGRVKAQGKLHGPAGADLALRASWPAVAAPSLSAPIDLDLSFGPVDLNAAGRELELAAVEQSGVHGKVALHLTAQGTIGAPQARCTLDLTELAAKPLREGALHAELSAGSGGVRLAAQVLLAGQKALLLEAHEPLDLARALRDPASLRHLFEQPGSLTAEVPQLPLEALVRAGLLPAGVGGTIAARAELGGTTEAPELRFSAQAEKLSYGPLQGLDLVLGGSAGKRLQYKMRAQAGEVARAKMEAEAELGALELVQLARSGFDRARLDPLLQRTFQFELELQELVIGRAAALAGRDATAQGTLTGRVRAGGTADAPHFEGHLALQDLEVGRHALGQAEVWIEGDGKGAKLHLAIDPPLVAATGTARLAAAPVATSSSPGDTQVTARQTSRAGGSLLLHATLEAPLTVRGLLDNGPAALLEGRLDGHLLARRFDLGFASGLAPSLRRTAGRLDAEIELRDLLGHAESEGEAHLRDGLFDVVGQGLFQDVAFDATFTPKEIVVDRVTGSASGGPFSAVLVFGRRPPGADGDQPLDFTGELHAGDEEAVRDRKDALGQPLRARALPLRIAGEEKADLVAEVDFFGEYLDGKVTATVKIPQAALHVRAMPEKKLPRLEPHPDLHLAPPRGAQATAAAARAASSTAGTAGPNLHVDLKLQLEHLRVSADDFDFPVKSELTASWDSAHPAEPSADGSIEVSGGSFSALGRRFEIDVAKITETGGDLADPELEVQARFVSAQATVLVMVSGTAKDPQIDLSSSPAMDPDAIAFFLATGRLQGRATQQGGGVDLSNAATSALGGVLFGELRKQMADVLPVDVLTVEAGGAGQPAQASLGKYVGDRFFVGYRQRLAPAASENASEGRVEYEIVRGLGAEATVGEKNSDVAVLYTVDF